MCLFVVGVWHGYWLFLRGLLLAQPQHRRVQLMWQGLLRAVARQARVLSQLKSSSHHTTSDGCWLPRSPATADPDDKVASWWDYGYQTTAMANRTVIVDNNTWNNTHIATVRGGRRRPGWAAWLGFAWQSGWLAHSGSHSCRAACMATFDGRDIMRRNKLSGSKQPARPSACLVSYSCTPRACPCPRRWAAPWPAPRRRRGRSSAPWTSSTCLWCSAATSGERGNKLLVACSRGC